MRAARRQEIPEQIIRRFDRRRKGIGERPGPGRKVASFEPDALYESTFSRIFSSGSSAELISSKILYCLNYRRLTTKKIQFSCKIRVFGLKFS